ncbi:MAG: hypothetical protein QW568_00190 [Candidatus Anstonellaceae archaeon]
MPISVREAFLKYRIGHTPEDAGLAVSRQKAQAIFQNLSLLDSGQRSILCMHAARNAESLLDSIRAVNILEKERDWGSLAKLAARGADGVAFLSLLALERNRRWLEIRQAVTDASWEVGSQAVEMLINENKLDELRFIKKEGCHPTTLKAVEKGIRKIEKNIEEKIAAKDVEGLLHIAKSRLGTLKRELEALGVEVSNEGQRKVLQDEGFQRIIARTILTMNEEEIIGLIDELEGKGGGVQQVAKALYDHQDSETAMRVLRRLGDRVKKAHLLEGALLYVKCAIEEKDLAKLVRIARGIEREFKTG